MSYLNTDNFSLEVKYLFLSFAQGYFGQARDRYMWRNNVRTTDIIIADKFSVDLGVATQRPSIILSRGRMGWTYSVRGQTYTQNPMSTGTWRFGAIGEQPLDADRYRGTAYTDLLNSSITYNVISKQGVEAEDIANKLFVGMTGHREEFRKCGVLKFLSMNISEEQLLKYKGDVELYGVSVNTSFIMQKTVMQGDKDYNCRVWVDGVEVYENIHYRVLPEGTQIKFFEQQEEDAVVTITYIDAVTLETVEQAVMTTTDYWTYTIPDDGAVYGYYKIVEAILVDEYPILEDNYVDPVWSGVSYDLTEFSPNGTVVGDPVTEDQTYWHRILAGEFSDDTGQEREYVYTITSGNTNDAFAMDEDTGIITVANSGILDYGINPYFSLTAHVADEDGDDVTDDITITINLTE